MEITIEHVYKMIQDMDKRVNERLDNLKNDVDRRFDSLQRDHGNLSESVVRLEGRVDGMEKSINARLWYLNWLFAAVVVSLVGAVGKLLFFSG